MSAVALPREKAPGSHQPGVVVEELTAELVETQDQVVDRTDEFGCVDCSGLNCRQDLATRHVHLFTTKIAQDGACDARNAHLEALDVVGAVDLLREPATHLHTRVACRELDQPEFLGIELSHELEPAAVIKPCVLLA